MWTPLRRHWPWLGLLVLALITWCAYRPGLTGGFLFDDFVNLDALGNSGPVDNWRTFWRFITSGTADPTGRPLALLTFLIDAHDWPANPAPFLRTNVLLHLLNGALLFALLRQLETALGSAGPRRDLTALLAAGLWLLHPLWVSTTLYIVQREAMLPATFCLLGLLAFGSGRLRYTRTGGRAGLATMIGGIAFGTLLAVACKANGILLPLLAWVLDATVYRHHDLTAGVGDTAQRRWRRLRLALLVVPNVVLLVWVCKFILHWNAPLGSRPWTTAQRVITEPRVLLDYLQLLFVPRILSTGVFNDGYPASVDLWHPAMTLPALLAIAALLATGFALRRRVPAVSAALLFFFAGHLLESSTLPLELYFEHRNYLPGLLLFWPISRALSAWKSSAALRAGLAGLLLATFAIITWQRADLWGKPEQMAALWAKQNPQSSRAQAVAAIAQSQADHPDRALILLQPLWRRHPDDLQIAFNYVSAACATHGLTDADKDAVAQALRRTPGGQLLMFHWIGNAIDIASAGQCPGLGLSDVEAWLAAARSNPTLGNAYASDQDIEPLLAQIALRRQQPIVALQHFDRALAMVTLPDVAARQASMLAEDGYYEQALAHLDTYERLKSHARRPGWDMTWLHAKVLEWENYWPFEMARLRQKLHAAIAERDAKGGAIR
jgi:hypothetical protein